MRLAGARAPEPGRQPLTAMAGLQLIKTSPPCTWPADRLAEWPQIAAGAAAFERCWGDQAEVCGWSDLQLYGLHSRAPRSNLAAMGAAFLVAIGGHTVLAVSGHAIAIATPTGSRLRICRRPPDSSAVLVWHAPLKDVP